MGAAEQIDEQPQQRSSGRAMQVWQDFQAEIVEREQDIARMLPPHVRKERFIASAVAAVKQTPGLLKCSTRSLFAAITKSAQDGLLPDGREGVITAYGSDATWNPMTFGLRKRAREIDNIIIDAQVVYKNDHFVWHQGDEPHIEHTPATLGEPRGAKIGAYAIFKKDGEILHREVMDAEQIERVHNQAKAKNSLMWGTFAEEAWRKTVVRRGIKTVPCSERLEAIIRRDDDLFDFGNGKDIDLTTPPPPPPPPIAAADTSVATKETSKPKAAPPSPEPDIGNIPPDLDRRQKKAAPKAAPSREAEDAEIIDQETGEVMGDAGINVDPDLYLDDLRDRLVNAQSKAEVERIKKEHAKLAPHMFPPDRDKAEEMIADAEGQF